MSRIEATFAALAAQNRKALITFIMAGDTSETQSFDILSALPQAGADVIELGMPFTDPVADGPVIQAAGLRALAAGQTMRKTLAMVARFRQSNQNTPIVLMGYYNPLLQYGIAAFMQDAHTAGVDGLIIVDLPPEEAQEILPAMQAAEIDLIRLITPTTDTARLEKILEGASGFLYYVSVAGVTGSSKANLSQLQPIISQIKTRTDLPLAIGFGIKTPQDVQEMASLADAVVVGSAIVDNIHKNQGDKAVSIVSEQVQAYHKALV